MLTRTSRTLQSVILTSIAVCWWACSHVQPCSALNFSASG